MATKGKNPTHTFADYLRNTATTVHDESQKSLLLLVAQSFEDMENQVFLPGFETPDPDQ